MRTGNVRRLRRAPALSERTAGNRVPPGGGSRTAAPGEPVFRGKDRAGLVLHVFRCGLGMEKPGKGNSELDRVAGSSALQHHQRPRRASLPGPARNRTGTQCPFPILRGGCPRPHFPAQLCHHPGNRVRRVGQIPESLFGNVPHPLRSAVQNPPGSCSKTSSQSNSNSSRTSTGIRPLASTKSGAPYRPSSPRRRMLSSRSAGRRIQYSRTPCFS